MKTLLVTIANNTYYKQARQVLISAKINGGWDGDLMVITNDMNRKNTQSFEKDGIFVYHRPLVHSKDEWFSHLPSDTHLPPIMTLKYYLFTEEIKKWNRVVYLDSDIIVRSKIHSLLEIRNDFGAVRNLSMPCIENNFLKNNLSVKQKKQWENLGREHDIHSPSFNAGMFVFNPMMIPSNSFQFLKECLYQYGLIARFPEQPFTNLLFEDKWTPLPTNYNIGIEGPLKYLHFPPKLIDGRILHFNGRKKPWNPEHPFFKEWEHNADLDIKNKEFKGRNPGIVRTPFTIGALYGAKYWKMFKKKYVSVFRKKK